MRANSISKTREKINTLVDTTGWAGRAGSMSLPKTVDKAGGRDSLDQVGKILVRLGYGRVTACETRRFRRRSAFCPTEPVPIPDKQIRGAATRRPLAAYGFRRLSSLRYLPRPRRYRSICLPLSASLRPRRTSQCAVRIVTSHSKRHFMDTDHIEY